MVAWLPFLAFLGGAAALGTLREAEHAVGISTPEKPGILPDLGTLAMVGVGLYVLDKYL